jgi:Flp pilus assembly protein TadD
MGDYEKGRERYVQARELDTLRFRADNQINEVIKSVARDRTDEGVYLLDAVKAFEENSSYRTTGKELFYEHVHMNFKGNYLLAKAIYGQVEKILPDRIKTNKAKERPFPDKEECARNLAYTDWEEYKIYSVVLNDYIKQVPFTNQLYHDQRVSQMEQDLKNYEVSFSPEVVAEIDAQYRWSIEQMPSDWWLYWKYGEFLNEREKSTDAIRQYRSVLDYFPYHYEAYAKIGLLFGKGGDINAAIENNLKAVQIYPIFAEAYFNLGFAYHLQKKFDEAIEYYTKTLRLVPDRAEAYINLGLVLFQHGKVAEAMETYQSGLKVLPDNLDLHYNLGILLGEQGQRQEALKELRAALKIDPNSVKVRKVLRTIQKRK